jgi:primosomal protein N' (replication factor Y)
MRAVEEQLAAGGFAVSLLHGVTGSGKTEVYLRAATGAPRRAQVLLMVPEIALTPSVAALFRGAFGDRVAIQHSALSTGERHDQWHRIRRGDVDVVVGTRSAVFAPLHAAGPGDRGRGARHLLQAGRGPALSRPRRGHHARQPRGALVLLGSATPSMESYQHALTGKYRLLTLPTRVLDRPLAHVGIVNMREEYAEKGRTRC